MKKWFKKNGLHIIVTLMLACLVVLILWNNIFYTILPGQKGVVFYRFDGGTDTKNIVEEGMKAIFPWDKMYIYDTRQQVITNNISVLSKDGLKIRIELAVRFYPVRDSIGKIHQDLGPQYPRTVVVPEAGSSARKIIGRFTPDELYYIQRDSIETLILDDLRSELGDIDIVMNDVFIKNIKLPPLVAHAIEEKMKEEQKHLAFEFKLKRETEEAKRKEIEALGIKQFENLSGISILKWRGLDATEKLANSPNTKVVIVGTQSSDLPVILGGD